MTDSHRFLGEENDCIIGCCTAFGTRLCGGVGSIEPFTSMIALRLSRFYIARTLCRFYDNCIHSDGHQKEDEREKDCVLPPTLYQKSSEKVNLTQRHGTSAELWVVALREFPEIVEKHGIFSTQILEVMLGVQQLPQSNNEEEIAVKREFSNSNKGSVGGRLDEKVEKPLFHHRQESLMSDGIDLSASSDVSGKHIQNFGAEELESPTSILIRRMRRCEIKLLQVSKKKWTLVDVVLTKHEIVWFDANEMSLDVENVNLRKKLFTSKGGKGLRLCEVAAGRIILGRQLLTDIDEVKVKRLHSRLHTKKTKDTYVQDVEAFNMEKPDWEFWHFCDNEITHTMSTSSSLAPKWTQKTREDRLKLHTVHNSTLYLRFLVDLHAESKQSKIGDEKVEELQETEGALLWCRTLVHLCGKSQLEKRQKLPHFGDNSPSQELLDLVEEQERGEEKGIRNALSKGKDFISRGGHG